MSQDGRVGALLGVGKLVGWRIAFVLGAASLGCSVQTLPDAGPAPEPDAGAPARDAGGDPDAGAPLEDAGPCPAGEALRFGVCVPSPAACDGLCPSDACCADGECIPYGVGPCPASVEACEVGPPPAGAFAPVVECEWLGPGFDSASTPTVADMDVDGDLATRRPSIATVTLNGRLVLLDGATCVEQANLPIGANPSGSPVFADLDGDGRAELLVSVFPYVRAYAWDHGAGALVQRWETRAGGGPHLSAHDLDDDGRPEVIAGASVLDADGAVLIGASRTVSVSGVPTLADVDGDGRPELIAGDGLFEADLAGGDWRREGYWRAGSTMPRRAAAVADFGDLGDGPSVPEIAFAGDGRVALARVTGEVVLGPITVAPPYGAGPPLIVDADGDGQPEIGVAGDTRYWLLDLECASSPTPAPCVAPGVRWWHPIQDSSTGKTSSTAFDLDGDGRVEIIYADECFLRFFDGATGRLVFSAANTSSTIVENPIVVDVDGDARAELVVPRNATYAYACEDAYDPHFLGDACDPIDRPCRSELHACVDGVCRAPQQDGWGIRVYGDAADFWAGTRAAWNQHAYSITNVGDDGVVPRASAWVPSWAEPETNRYRANLQGPVPAAVPGPDLTAGVVSGWTCDGEARQRFVARVCNRGAARLEGSAPVSFDVAGERICEGRAPAGLEPGACEEVVCEWREAPEEPVTVRVVVDDEPRYAHQVRECREDNNEAWFVPACELI